ncbi:MAG: helix-turn-helix-type transcriptional regulator, partial [Cyclobacteriaceae bacterium]|nr:helix-turn-helix-type transcriptional regulator [Cyclobacteriaceae bacterium]
EHFISNLVRQKIIVAIDGQVVHSTNYNKKYLLYLPENELHEMSLLFSSYIIKSRNNKVIYIGQNVPHNDLIQIYKDHNPDYLLTVFTTSPTVNHTQAYIYKISDSFKNSTVLISGHQVVGQDMDLPGNIMLLNKLQDLIEFTEVNSKT